jgi:two-component system, OmpR family, response regulator
MRTQTPSRRPLRVLVVDDDADTAESLAELLTLRGFPARAVTDGESAIRAAASEPPDVIFTDLAMPGMDGFELAHRLRERSAPKRPLLVAVTGCQPEVVTGAEIYFDLVLTKPVSTATLIGLLRRFDQAIN